MAWLRRNKGCASYLVLFSVADFSIVTLFYPQTFSTYLSHFIWSFYNFSFTSSLCELWLLGIIRFSITIGAMMGMACGGKDGKERMIQIHLFIGMIALVMWSYGIVKMLVFTEEGLFVEPIYFWSLFGWTLLSSMMMYINWRILACSDISEIRISCEQASVNSCGADTEHLIQNVEPLESPYNTPPPATILDKDLEEVNKVKPVTLKSSAVWKLMKFSKPDIPYLMIAFTFMTVSAVAEIFTPWYTGQVIQGIAIDRDKDKFTHAIIYMGLLSAASSVAAGFRGGFFKITIARLNIRVRCQLFASLLKQEVGFYDTTKTGIRGGMFTYIFARYDLRIRNCLFKALLSQEVGFFDKTKTGDITSRLTSDTTTMSDALSLNMNVFLRSLIQAVGTCIFMVHLSWRLSMVTVIGLPVIMVVSKVYGDFYEALTKKVQDTLAKANEVADEVCSTIRTVRSFANERTETQRYQSKLQDTFKLKKTESFAYAGYMWITNLLTLSLTIATLYYGGHLVINNHMSGGELVSFILYQMELGFSLQNIAGVYTGLMQAVGASVKVFELLERSPQLPNTGTLCPPHLRGELQFEDVCFAYPSRPKTMVLKNLSFHVTSGEVIALVGPSGGGKSSCVNLLEHFYEPECGRVLLDGIPIQEYDHKYLHSKIALVGQEPVLYAQSIQENIAYGMDMFTPCQVEEAAKLANAHDFICEMKEKYNTQTGEKGLQLSGGQKQRVAIARAIIRQPAILLLDEATSALDTESEHVVQEAMYRNLSGRTVIIIAHRLSTVERADRILVINQGQLVEQGTHTQLLKQGGLYTRLVQRQLFGFTSVERNTDAITGGKDECSSFKSIDSFDDRTTRRTNSSEHSPNFGTPNFGSLH